MITIHNLKFQGVWDVKTIKQFTMLPDFYFTPDKLEAYKDGNLLKGGIVHADAITTVSNTYAGGDQNAVLWRGPGRTYARPGGQFARDCERIDYEEFNPETDPHIDQHYNAKNFRKER